MANHFVFEHEVYCNLLNQNESTSPSRMASHNRHHGFSNEATRFCAGQLWITLRTHARNYTQFLALATSRNWHCRLQEEQQFEKFALKFKDKELAEQLDTQQDE